MVYKLYAIRIFTAQWDAALAFYRDTIGMPVFFSDADMGWAQFDLGGSYLGLERIDPHDPEGAELVGRFVGVSIRVEDIHAVHAGLLAKGVEFIGPPARQPWGGVLAHFKDPDGNVLTLMGS